MPVKPLFLLLLALPLSGCLQNRVEERGGGAYRLVAGYDDRDGLQSVLAENRRLADELCPGGWFKNHDFDRKDGGGRELVWEITCDAQYQYDPVQKKVQ